MSNITPDGLEVRLEREAPFVLDNRPEDEFVAGHIDGSHNVLVYDALGRGNGDALRDRLDLSLPTTRS